MNEDDLKTRWDAAFKATKEHKKALLAVEEDKATRAAKYGLAMKSAKDAKAMAAIQKQANDAVGTGRGEIQLAALQAAHTNEMADYIDKATKDHAKVMMTAGTEYKRTPGPDFSTHFPYIEPGDFNIGAGKGTKQARSFEPPKAPPGGPSVITPDQQAILDKHEADQLGIATDHVNQQKKRANRPPQGDVGLGVGGTLTKGGRTFYVDQNSAPGQTGLETYGQPGDAPDAFGRSSGTFGYGSIKVKPPGQVKPQTTPLTTF